MIAVAAAPSTGVASSPAAVPAEEQAPVAGATGESEQPSFGSVLAREAGGDQNAPSPLGGTAGAKSHKADDSKKVKDDDTAPVPTAIYAQTPAAVASAQLPPPLPWPAVADGGAVGSGPKTKEGSTVAGIQPAGATARSATARDDLQAGLDLASAVYAGHIQGRPAVGSALESSSGAPPAGDDMPSGGSVDKNALPSGIDIASGSTPDEIKTLPTNPAPPSTLTDRTAPVPGGGVTRVELGKSAPPLAGTTMEATILGSDRGKTRESNRGEGLIKSSLVRSDLGKSGAADPALSAPVAKRARDAIQVPPSFMSSPHISLPDREARPGGANPFHQADSGVRTAGMGAGTSSNFGQPIAVTASTTTALPTAPTHTSARSAGAYAGAYATSPGRTTAAPSIIRTEHVQPAATVTAPGTAKAAARVNLISNPPTAVPNPAFGPKLSAAPMRVTPAGTPRSAGPAAASVSVLDKNHHVDSTDTAHGGDTGITPNWPGLPSVPAAPSSAPSAGGNTTVSTGAGVSVYQPIVQGVLVHGASLHVMGAASSFNVVLTPPSLGMVTVHVAHGQTGLQVVITPHQSDTTALLNQHLPDLVGMLKQGGQDLPVQAQIVQTHGAAPSPAGTPQAAGAGQSGLNFATNSGGQSFAGGQGNADQRAWAAAAGDLFGRQDQGNTAIAPTADRLPARISALARIDLHA